MNEIDIDKLTRSLLEDQLEKPSSHLNTRIMNLQRVIDRMARGLLLTDHRRRWNGRILVDLGPTHFSTSSAVCGTLSALPLYPQHDRLDLPLARSDRKQNRPEDHLPVHLTYVYVADPFQRERIVR